jgi:hypothetical protein
MSIRAVANYEKDREPNKQALFQFAQYANELKRPDLAKIFAELLEMDMGYPVREVIGDLENSAIVALAINNGQDWFRRSFLLREMEALIRRARAHKQPQQIVYPEMWDANRVPDQEARIRYLEELADDLRKEAVSLAPVGAKPKKGARK